MFEHKLALGGFPVIFLMSNARAGKRSNEMSWEKGTNPNSKQNKTSASHNDILPLSVRPALATDEQSLMT